MAGLAVFPWLVRWLDHSGDERRRERTHRQARREELLEGRGKRWAPEEHGSSWRGYGFEWFWEGRGIWGGVDFEDDRGVAQPRLEIRNARGV